MWKSRLQKTKDVVVRETRNVVTVVLMTVTVTDAMQRLLTRDVKTYDLLQTADRRITIPQEVKHLRLLNNQKNIRI